MHKRENNKLKNFTQGLRPFSSAIPKTLKKYLRKGGYNYSNIVDNWTKMVNKKISDSSYPISVKMGKEMKNGTLVLNVLHGKEVEIEYSKKEILDKINSFFGYDCISKVELKIVQEKIKDDNIQVSKIKNYARLNEKINNLSDNQLKSSLNNLLKAFNGKNK